MTVEGMGFIPERLLMMIYKYMMFIFHTALPCGPLNPAPNQGDSTKQNQFMIIMKSAGYSLVTCVGSHQIIMALDPEVTWGGLPSGSAAPHRPTPTTYADAVDGQ